MRLEAVFSAGQRRATRPIAWLNVGRNGRNPFRDSRFNFGTEFVQIVRFLADWGAFRARTSAMRATSLRPPRCYDAVRAEDIYASVRNPGGCS